MILSQITTISTNAAAQSGIGLGSILAVTFSWTRNRSIFWAIVAGIFSWFYVIHFALTRRPDERRSSMPPFTPLRSRVEKKRIPFTRKDGSPINQDD